MSAAEDVIRGTGWFESEGQAHAKKVAASIVEALRADPGALADLVDGYLVPLPELEFWKNLLTTRTETLRARAEKAEQERDALRDQLNEAKLQNVLHLDRIDALLSTPAPLPPMTTVDEDGRVWRIEQPMSEDGFDGAGYDTHPPHTVTFFGLRRDGAMERPDRIKRLYRLVPVEGAP